MCDYCKDYKNENLIKTEIREEIWTGEIYEVDYGVFIDRGYLRFCELNDTNCLEGGDKIEINFCPICGNKIEKLEKKGF